MKDKMTSTDNKVTAHSLGSINTVKSLAKHNALYIYSTLTMMLFKLSERLFRLGLGEALPKNSNLSQRKALICGLKFTHWLTNHDIKNQY